MPEPIVRTNFRHDHKWAVHHVEVQRAWIGPYDDATFFKMKATADVDASKLKPEGKTYAYAGFRTETIPDGAGVLHTNAYFYYVADPTAPPVLNPSDLNQTNNAKAPPSVTGELGIGWKENKF